MEVSFSPLAATGKPLSRCGKCHRFMKYIQVTSPHAWSLNFTCWGHWIETPFPLLNLDWNVVVKRAFLKQKTQWRFSMGNKPTSSPTGVYWKFWILLTLQLFRRLIFYFQAKPSRLHCSHCDDTYSLPQNGTIKLYKELRCPLDDFELVLWLSGSRGKSYPLCPYCYNHPPFRDMKKGRNSVNMQRTTSFEIA